MTVQWRGFIFIEIIHYNQLIPSFYFLLFQGLENLAELIREEIVLQKNASSSQ